MKRAIILVMMTAGLLCAGPLKALENKAPIVPESIGPKIEIKDLRHDFGKISKGTKLTHTFEVKNVGNEQLIIQKVQGT